MRKLEGGEPLTWEQFRAKVKMEKADDPDGKNVGDSSKGYWKNGKWYNNNGKKSSSRGSRSGGRRSSGGSSEKTYRTGVADSLPGIGDTPSAIKQVKASAPTQMKNVRKAFKKPRATGRSKIRIII